MLTVSLILLDSIIPTPYVYDCESLPYKYNKHVYSSTPPFNITLKVYLPSHHLAFHTLQVLLIQQKLCWGYGSNKNKRLCYCDLCYMKFIAPTHYFCCNNKTLFWGDIMVTLTSIRIYVLCIVAQFTLVLVTRLFLLASGPEITNRQNLPTTHE